MRKPRIKDLNEFVQLYHSILLDKPHRVKWKKMEDWGDVDYYSDTIYLNPTIPLKSRWVHIINKKYVSSVKLSLEKVNSIFLLFFMKQLILKCTTTPHPFQKNGLIFM